MADNIFTWRMNLSNVIFVIYIDFSRRHGQKIVMTAQPVKKPAVGIRCGLSWPESARHQGHIDRRDHMLSMLSGSTVTMAWRVLGLWIKKTASRYGGYMRIYWISSRGQPTVGGPPAWGLGGGLTTLPRKSQYLLRITKHSLGTGRITWHNLSTGKWTWDLVHGMLGAYIGQVHWKR
jgi:hypothetical protein